MRPATLGPSLRRLRHTPGFAIGIAALVALAVGAIGTLAAVVHAVLLRPLPYAHADRVVVVQPWRGGAPTPYVGRDAFRALTGPGAAFADAAAFVNVDATLTGPTDRVLLHGYVVTPNLFRVLGARAAHGRAFTGAMASGSDREIVLSDVAWRRVFGGDPAILDRTVVLDGVPRRVVGIMPPEVRFPDASSFRRVARAEFWVPFPAGVAPMGLVVARLAPGVPIGQARAFADRIARTVPDRGGPPAVGDAPRRLTLTALAEQMTADVRRPLWLLFAGVVGLGVVAGGNIAGLWLVRFAGRRREIAIRVALGAPRHTIVGAWLTEALLLTAVGGVAGLGLATWGVRAIATRLPLDVPRLDQARLGGLEIVVALLLAAVATALGVLAAGRRATRAAPATALVDRRGGWRTATGRAWRQVLVVAQLALSTVLAVSAGLLLHSLTRLAREPLGFDADHVLAADLSATVVQPADLARASAAFTALATEVRALPGVRGASYVFPAPLTPLAAQGAVAILTRADGPVDDRGAGSGPAEVALVGVDYFATMGVTLLRGRGFRPGDGPGAPRVAIVDEYAAARYWPGADPIGARLRTNYNPGDTTSAVVVGIVRATKFASVAGDGAAPSAQLYLPLERDQMSRRTLVVRTTGDPAALTAVLRARIQAAGPGLTLGVMMPMHAVVARSLGTWHVVARTAGLGALATVLVAALGVYSVIAQSVAERTAELGVRAALGADRPALVGLVLRDGARLGGIGVTLGVVLALALTRVLDGYLFGVSTYDGASFAAGAFGLLAVTALAALRPAWRASGVDPLIALRAE